MCRQYKEFVQHQHGNPETIAAGKEVSVPDACG